MPKQRPSKLEAYQDRAIAEQYDQRWASARGKHRDLRKALLLQQALDCVLAHDCVLAAGKHRASTLLDIPCGTGRFSHLWESRGLQTLGADLALAMLQKAQQKHPASTFFAADLAQLPCADASVDVAICVRFLHLVREPTLRIRFLAELRRVCKYGAVIDYHHKHTFRVWGQQLRFRLGLRSLSPVNPSFSQIRKELAAAGWKVVAWLPVRKIPWMSDKLLLAVVPQKQSPDRIQA